MTQSASIRNCTSFLTACSSLLCFNAPASLEKKTQPHDRPLKQFTGKLVTSSNVYNVLVLMAAHAHTHLLKGRTTVPLIDQVYHSNLQMLTVPHLRHNTAGAHIHKILKPRATGRLSTRMHTSKRFCFWHHYACISSHARKLKLFCSPPSAQHITPLCSASYTPPFCITHPSVLHHTPFRPASHTPPFRITPPSVLHHTPLRSASHPLPFCITPPSVLHHTPLRSASHTLPFCITTPPHYLPQTLQTQGGTKKTAQTNVSDRARF